jgi:segregation and condensation protein B
MEIINWNSILESLLFAAGDEGLSLKQLAEVLEVSELHASEMIEDLRQEYDRDDKRGIMIV